MCPATTLNNRGVQTHASLTQAPNLARSWQKQQLSTTASQVLSTFCQVLKRVLSTESRCWEQTLWLILATVQSVALEWFQRRFRCQDKPTKSPLRNNDCYCCCLCLRMKGYSLQTHHWSKDTFSFQSSKNVRGSLFASCLFFLPLRLCILPSANTPYCWSKKSGRGFYFLVRLWGETLTSDNHFFCLLDRWTETDLSNAEIFILSCHRKERRKSI